MSQIKMRVQEWIDLGHSLSHKAPMARFEMRFEPFHRQFLKLLFDASSIGDDGKRGGSYDAVDPYSDDLMPK